MSAKDVAQWMLDFMGESHWLYQEVIVYRIRDHWGTDYVYQNANGNLAIAKPVLKEFRKLTDGRLIWERGERAWRPIKPHETGRMAE
jgi:hypothetical protein